MRPPIFNQRLPKYDQRQKGRQHQRCEHHLDDRETGRVFAKKPTCNNAAGTQEPVSGPSEPIKHISPPAAIDFHALYLSVAISTRSAISLLVNKQSKHSRNYRQSNQSTDDERYNRMATGLELLWSRALLRRSDAQPEGEIAHWRKPRAQRYFSRGTVCVKSLPVRLAPRAARGHVDATPPRPESASGPAVASSIWSALILRTSFSSCKRRSGTDFKRANGTEYGLFSLRILKVRAWNRGAAMRLKH